jgi:DNA-binding transcriptional LysR family regulator
MDARRLLIFRSVARAGSISSAARELGWTQPAVSQHLAALEREVGNPLLLRGPRGVELTDAGRLLVARADAIAGELHMADEEQASLRQLRRGTVRLGAFPSAAATQVPQAIAGLRQHKSGVDVMLTVAEPPEARQLVENGELDVALVFRYSSEPAEPDRSLVWRPLGHEPVLLVLPGAHPLAGRRLTMRQLAKERWIAGCPRCRLHLTRLCERAGFQPVIEHITDDYVVVQNLTAVGLGVAFLPQAALDAFRHPGVVVSESAAWGRRTYGVVYREGADRVPATAALLRELAASPSALPSPATGAPKRSPNEGLLPVSGTRKRPRPFTR